MRFPFCKILTGLAILSACVGTAQAAAKPATPVQCEIDRPVKFGGMNWSSNLVMVELERFIMEKGYGCRTQVLPVETLPALAALERGDLDINSEVWLNSVADPWAKAVKTGKVARIGELYQGGEAWFIPRYTAERLPGLKSVADLPKYKKEFQDPEEPSKGRFYTCPAGWGCEVTNSNLYRAFKLHKSYTLYSPGTGAAQKAAIMSAYQRKQNIVFYYWYPTPLVGALDLVKLKMPPYDAKTHPCLTSPSCKNPQPSGYPANPVFTAVSTKFEKQAPKLTEFLSKVSIPLPEVNATLAHMQKTGDEAPDVAKWFLKNEGATWKQWVPADVAQRVQAAL